MVIIFAILVSVYFRNNIFIAFRLNLNWLIIIIIILNMSFYLVNVLYNTIDITEVGDITGLSNLTSTDINVYPNPTCGIVEIVSDKQIRSVIVYDNVGKMILEKSIQAQKTTLDLTDCKGLVYIDVIFEDGHKITENLATDYPEVDKFNEQTSTYSGSAVFDSRYFRLSSYPDLMTAVNHRHYLRFPAREAERTEFLVSGDFRGYLEDKRDFVHSRKRFPELHYFAVSEDYDKYLIDTYHLEQVSNSSDLSAIFLRDNVYTNVHGAVGIFGAKIERTLIWEGDSNWGSGPFLFSGLESRIVDYTINDRSPFYEEEEYRGHDMYPYDEEEKNRVTNIKSVNWQSHRDFSLLHYEVRAGIPDDWKYGIKDAKKPVNAGTYPTYYLFKQAVYRIDDEEQLREHGLEEYGPVDFTLNTVIVAYARGNWRAYFPYLVDYLVSEDRTNGRCRHMFYWAHIADNGWTQHSIGILRAEESYVLNPAISSRVALVVDKIGDNDELCLSWDSYIAASTRVDEQILLVEDEILPEMGVTDFNVLVDLR